uniref:ZP domain-containing protein n=1 Tax=Xiphophorus couchianus TaxID=32473 RepID=A0A3B5L2V1_9TELE
MFLILIPRRIFLLLAAANIEAQQKPPINIRAKCLGNIMRVDVGPLGGSLLDVAVIINNTAIVVTPSIAAQCGFSMKSDSFGNALIYISLQNCFAQNVDDELFTTALQLRLQGNQFSQEEVYQVAETCQYDVWASREVICDYNYMEVSVKRATPEDFPLCPLVSDMQKRSMDAGFKATTIVFFTPEGKKPMSLLAAQQRGYGIGNTPTRLVLRSPMIAPETFMQTVNLSTALHIPKLKLVFFTQSTITWYLPWQMDPMTSSGQFNLLEVHFGINGQKLDAVEMQAREYSVALNDFYIVTELPIGGVGGYYESHIQGDLYYVSYMIEPMLELLWTEDATHEQTRYKVFFHITTHLLPQPLELIDNTVPGEKMFRMTLGHFAADVALMNITFPAEVLSMPDCSARGFNILEHMSPNTSLKVFTLQVPFADPAVLQQTGEGVTVYSLHLTFGLLILDQLVSFSHKAYLEAVVQDIVPPSVSGGCDNHNFYVLVKYGSPGYNFQTMVGKRYMTPSLAQHYDSMENGTHFSFVVPFSAPDVAVEAIEASSTRSRLDIVLSNPETNSQIQELSVACNFPSTLTECFPNGTMTALALKLESVPLLNPSQLTLADPSCGPVHSDDRYAFFVFTVNSCGTTRKFMTNVMLYENEISLPDELLMKKSPTSEEPEYYLKISCFYDINTSQTVAFNTRLRRSEPYAENSKGQLQVVMRLALDDSYSAFQNYEEYPLAKYLQQPLYFEVELLKSANPLISLELENCWATQGKDRTSQPRWDLIINGCPNPADPYQVVFHPVWTDARVGYPSHFKRFEIQTFAFQNDILILQLFVHCDIVICDSKNPLGGICGGQCSNPKQTTKGEMDDFSFGVYGFEYVSLGPIRLNL